MTRRRKRLLIWIPVLAAVTLVGAIIWGVIADATRPLDIRADVSRAAIVAYGHVASEGGRSRVVVQEIWKHSSSAAPLSIGASFPSRLPAGAKPDSLILFFSAHESSPDAIIAVYGDRVPAAEMSLPELKALCAASPGT
jgi:hypothetical protein